MVAPDSQDISRGSWYLGIKLKQYLIFKYGTFTLFGRPFQNVFLIFPVIRSDPATPLSWFRLIRLRSPLLTESLSISFLPGTEMFHFPEFPCLDASIKASLGFHQEEFPHSETAGSTFVDNSPTYIAAFCVLLRLQPPRHPPFALFKFLNILATQFSHQNFG